MNQELFINVTQETTEIALLEDKLLVGLHQEQKTRAFSVGDIFLGKVKRIVSGLNAAFVDLGYGKDGFLHYTDLGPNIRSLIKFTGDTLSGRQQTHLLNDFKLEPETVKTGKIADWIRTGQMLMVQIDKEPISTKGPRLSSQITLAGRYQVLYPFNDMIGISKRISEHAERQRLERLIESIRPKYFGVIVRTAAEGKKVAELNDDLSELAGKWEQCHKNLRELARQGGRPGAPVKLLSEVGRTHSLLRDIITPSFNSIVTNDQQVFEEVKAYLRKIAPQQERVVSLYTGSAPMFDVHNITKQIKSSFGKIVSIPSSSAYVIIENTEALHVIDVNSGKKVDEGSNAEENVFKVNMDAAVEIARQIRLRDMGGIIVIDFIDMRNPANRKKLYDHFRKQMKNDRTRHNILPLSKFGLMQMTRERVRPEIQVATAEVCPTCRGTGEAKPALLIIDEIENSLKDIVKNGSKAKKLFVHPFIHAFLTKGVWSVQKKWWMKYGSLMQVLPMDAYPLNEYRFVDSNGDEIEMHKVA